MGGLRYGSREGGDVGEEMIADMVVVELKRSNAPTHT